MFHIQSVCVDKIKKGRDGVGLRENFIQDWFELFSMILEISHIDNLLVPLCILLSVSCLEYWMSLDFHLYDLFSVSQTLICPRLLWVMASAEMVKVLVYRCNHLTDRATSAGASCFWPHQRPSPRPVRFIVNYGRLQGSQSQVDSYINLVLFMGNYKTPRIFFYLMRLALKLQSGAVIFFNLSSHRFLEPWVICSSSSFFNSRHLLWLKAIWLICCHL